RSGRQHAHYGGFGAQSGAPGGGDRHGLAEGQVPRGAGAGAGPRADRRALDPRLPHSGRPAAGDGLYRPHRPAGGDLRADGPVPAAAKPAAVGDLFAAAAHGKAQRGAMTARSGPSKRRRILIVNADDLGLSDGVTAGIVKAWQEGVVTSTSALVNIEGAPERIARVHREHPD